MAGCDRLVPIMGATKVLVVEDDAAIAQQISQGLRSSGFEIDLAPNGQAALESCRHARFDAIVLDRMLPDLSGVAVIEGLRHAGAVPPVLMLSALGSVEDRVEGLVAGADDYLAKPFDMSELSARLVAICRRGPRLATPGQAGVGPDGAATAGTGPQDDEADRGALVVGRLRLDAASHRVLLGEEAIELNRKQFSLLAYLMRQPDRIVTRAMLIENVWGYAFDPATNIVESNLSRLRTRLQTLGCDPIETRRGEGYVLRAAACC
jgi:two-component system, OmpR family, response regulator